MKYILSFLLLLFFVAVPHRSDALVATTIKIYPADDGLNALYDNDNQTVWSAARSFTGTLFRAPTTTTDQLTTRGDKFGTGGKYRIYRTSSVFDTSVIPDDATIVAASFYGYKGYSNNHGQELVITAHTRASTLTLSKSDWALSNYGAEFSRGTLNSGYNAFNFNSTGKSYINKTGYTIIGGIQGNDIDNVDIGTTQSGTSIFSSDAAGTSTDPYLEITYTLPEEEVTVTSGVDKLKTYIAGFVNKAQQNSYTAHVKNILGFFETGKFTSTLNQLSALLQKVEADAAKGKLPPGVTEDMTETVEAMEELVVAAAESTEGVPLMTQIASPYPPESIEWADDIYGDGTPDWCGSTIGGCGCAITSLSMLGRNYGITRGYDGSDVNPGNMNAWLKANNGYTEINTIRWYYGLQYLSDTLGYSTLQLDALNSTNMSAIETAVAGGAPSVAFKKSKGHYFLLTDILPGGGFAVNDPFWYETKTLTDPKDVANHVQNYGGSFDQANLYSHSNAPRPFPRWVEIQLGSPAELLITDSKGRRTGYDVTTQQILTEIPGSSYAQAAGVATADVLGSNVHLPKVLAITAPEDDLYTLEVIGTGAGKYTLSVDTGGGYGDSEISAIQDTTVMGQVDTYIIDVPVRQSSDRAVTRLRELADAKEVIQPTVAEKLREIADRLVTKNFESVTQDVANLLQ